MRRKIALFTLLSLLVAAPVFAADAGKVDAKAAVTAPATKVVTTPMTTPAAEPKAAATAEPKAAEPTAPTYEAKWWQVGLKHLLELVFMVLGLLATAFVTVLMRKYGFEDQSNKVNDILTKALGYAEQLSIKKAKLDGKPTSGGEKMDLAIKFAQKLAQDYKVADKGKEWWEEKLESWLGVQKNGSVSSTNS